MARKTKLKRNRKSSKTSPVNTRGGVLPQEALAKIQKFNSETLTNAVRAAYLQILPHIADSGFEIRVPGRTFYLSPDAPSPSKQAAMFLSIVNLSREIFARDNVEEMVEVALFIGLFGVVIMHSCGTGKTLSEVLEVFMKDQDARRRGGKATVKWTPDVDKMAREIFAEVKRGKKVSNNAAVQRTRAKLAERGHNIGKTLIWDKVVGGPGKRAKRRESFSKR